MRRAPNSLERIQRVESNATNFKSVHAALLEIREIQFPRKLATSSNAGS